MSPYSDSAAENQFLILRVLKGIVSLLAVLTRELSALRRVEVNNL
jgi:hypothetical protein